MSAQTQDTYAASNAHYGAGAEKAQSSPTFMANSGTPPVHVSSPLLFNRPLSRRTGAQRFLRAFVWIAFALIATSVFVQESRHVMRTLIGNERGRPHNDLHPPHEHVSDSCIHDADWSFNNDTEGVPIHFAHSANTSFDLPLDSDLLYLVSRGSTSLAHGSVEITDSGKPGSDLVNVEISAFYDKKDVFDLVKVCMLQPEEGRNGVGIFAPPGNLPRHHRERVQFRIRVHLPPSSGDSPVLIKKFETDLPIFIHHVGDIRNSIFFNAISLRSSNVPFKVDSLASQHATIKTSNGPIEGSFNSSGGLELRTSNAFIQAEVGLSNDDPDFYTTLSMKTSNGPIASNVSLISDAPDGTGGSFTVHATTSNSPLAISYSVAPVDSTLYFSAHTSNSPARAELHKTFEGAFSLKSSSRFVPVVNADMEAEDPAGRSRQRVVETQRASRGTVQGTAKWSSAEESKHGWAEVSTSNMGVSLSL